MKQERVKVITWYESIVRGCLVYAVGFFLFCALIALVIDFFTWVF